MSVEEVGVKEECAEKESVTLSARSELQGFTAEDEVPL